MIGGTAAVWCLLDTHTQGCTLAISFADCGLTLLLATCSSGNTVNGFHFGAGFHPEPLPKVVMESKDTYYS